MDNKGAKVDPTMAYVGTRALFERAGFTKAADTRSVSGGFPRVLMRLNLGTVEPGTTTERMVGADDPGAQRIMRFTPAGPQQSPRPPSR